MPRWRHTWSMRVTLTQRLGSTFGGCLHNSAHGTLSSRLNLTFGGYLQDIARAEKVTLPHKLKKKKLSIDCSNMQVSKFMFSGFHIRICCRSAEWFAGKIVTLVLDTGATFTERTAWDRRDPNHGHSVLTVPMARAQQSCHQIKSADAEAACYQPNESSLYSIQK